MSYFYNYIFFIFFKLIDKRVSDGIFISVHHRRLEKEKQAKESSYVFDSRTAQTAQQPADFSLLLGALGASPDTVDDWQLSLASICARHTAPQRHSHRLSPAINCPPPQNAF